MRVQSDSVNSVAAFNLQPLEAVLPAQFAHIEFDYVLDTLLEVVFEPGFAQPFQVRIDLETVADFDELIDARQEFEFLKAELESNLRWGVA